MSGGKKHPLEIFKASGRSLGGRMPHRGAEPSGVEGESSGTPELPDSREQPESKQTSTLRGTSGPYPARPVPEFELRLSLPGALILLFSWVILMGGAYIYGHSRGQDARQGARREERDQAALALGRRIESGPASPEEVLGRESSAPVSKPRPFGVLLVTYQGYQEELIKEISKVLRESYRVTAPIQPWKHKDGKVEVFVGVFDRDDDPELKKLEASVRRIRDWPSGRDKTPFEDAYLKQHPGVPSSLSSAAQN